MTKEERFRKLALEIADLYERKNNDYGDSFGSTWKLLGNKSALTRMCDKLNRLINLLTNKSKPSVTEESKVDTLKDLAAYSIMTIIELEDEEKELLKDNLHKNNLI